MPTLQELLAPHKFSDFSLFARTQYSCHKGHPGSVYSVIQFAMDRAELCKGFEEDKERPYNAVQYYEALPASARGVFYCWLISYVS